MEVLFSCRGIPLFREDVTIGADLWAHCLSSLWKLGATILDLGGDQWINLRDVSFHPFAVAYPGNLLNKTPDCPRDPGSAVVPSLGKSNLGTCNLLRMPLISTTYGYCPES